MYVELLESIETSINMAIRARISLRQTRHLLLRETSLGSTLFMALRGLSKILTPTTFSPGVMR
jgi:hypothetical protein